MPGIPEQESEARARIVVEEMEKLLGEQLDKDFSCEHITIVRRVDDPDPCKQTFYYMGIPIVEFSDSEPGEFQYKTFNFTL